jgi:copper chaperone NosL
MKNNRMSLGGRIIIVLSSLALFAVLLFPMWQIQLSAPQYPEGLVLLIFPNKLGGNIDIINGLNHYIGMKTLHTTDFFEFTVLPYIIGFFGVALLIVGIIGKRRLLNIIFILFIFFGVVAMIDFWKWEYNYGHNLNPDAAIVVPGMAYQPPLIGFKQLLNFGAYSIPDIGGWIFVGVGIAMLVVVAAEWNAYRKRKHSSKALANSLALLLLVFFSSCNAKPEPITIGKDDCFFCKMKISDNRFGAEFITKKGKTYKFDDIHCIVSLLQEKKFDRAEIKEIYLTDFSNGHSLIKATDAMLLKSDALRAPMGGNIASFSNADSIQFVSTEYKGSILHWDDVYKQ